MKIRKVVWISDAKWRLKLKAETPAKVREGNLIAFWFLQPYKLAHKTYESDLYVVHRKTSPNEDVFVLTEAGNRIVFLDTPDEDLAQMSQWIDDFDDPSFFENATTDQFFANAKPLFPLQTHLVFQRRVWESQPKADVLVWRLKGELSEAVEPFKDEPMVVLYATLELSLVGYWLFDGGVEKVTVGLPEDVAWGASTFEEVCERTKELVRGRA